MKTYSVRVSYVVEVTAETQAEAKRRAVAVEHRPRTARVVAERDEATHVCTFCGRAARGLWRERDAAGVVHWVHRACVAEAWR